MTTLEATDILKRLRELGERLDLHALEMSNLRAFLDTQFKRIADLQAELDVLPAARRRREALRREALAAPALSGGNGQSPR